MKEMSHQAKQCTDELLNGELPVKENHNNERHIYRGLFQSEQTLINVDANGSLQVMKKVFPNSEIGYGVEAVLTPTIINVV